MLGTIDGTLEGGVGDCVEDGNDKIDEHPPFVRANSAWADCRWKQSHVSSLLCPFGASSRLPPVKRMQFVEENIQQLESFLSCLSCYEGVVAATAVMGSRPDPQTPTLSSAPLNLRGSSAKLAHPPSVVVVIVKT